MPIARTLAEAEIYVALETAQAGPEPGLTSVPAPDFELGENIVEGPDAWTYLSPIGEITIPYSSQRSSTRLGAHWGLGRSQLVDAAEWAESAPLARFRLAGSSLYHLGSTPSEAFVDRFDLEVSP